MADSPWLTLNEAAGYTKLSTASITRARKSGSLRGYKVQGKKLWRFNVADLDQWIVSAEQPAFVPYEVTR